MIAKVAVQAAPYAIDKAYDYLLPRGHGGAGGLPCAGPLRTGQPVSARRMILSLGDRRAGQAAEGGAVAAGRGAGGVGARRYGWRCGCGSGISARFTMRCTPSCPQQCGTVIGSCGAWRTACCRRAFRKRRRLCAACWRTGRMETDALKQALGDDVAPLLRRMEKAGKLRRETRIAAVRCGTRWICS